MPHTPLLFQPISFRSVTARNRIVVSPMCQYSATDGLGDDWHIQHLGARAMGGAGIVFTEATHVSAIGRITHHCLGLWNEAHQALLRRVVAIIERGGAVPGIQLAHAGRKASVARPWEGGAPIAPDDGGWVPLAPSALPMVAGATDPHALSTGEIGDIAGQFAHAARLAREAGVRVLELHGAHGYLLHSFLSPISNHRNDGYGGDLEGRSRFLMETLDAVRAEWPAELPLWVRLSCTDWMPGGLDDRRHRLRLLPLAGSARRCGPDRLFVGRRVAGPAHPVAASRLPGAVCRGGEAGCRHSQRCGRADHRADPCGRDPGQRPRRCGAAGARGAGRSRLAAARGEGVGGETGGAAAIHAGGILVHAIGEARSSFCRIARRAAPKQTPACRAFRPPSGGGWRRGSAPPNDRGDG